MSACLHAHVPRLTHLTHLARPTSPTQTSPYNSLDALLAATQTQLSALLAQAEKLQQHIQYIRGTVAAATELLLQQTRLHYGLDSRSYEVLRAYLPSPGMYSICLACYLSMACYPSRHMYFFSAPHLISFHTLSHPITPQV